MSLSGAIFIGMSGMNAYSNGLQIISNNVANLDTLGYKAETVGFSDLYSYGRQGSLSFLGSDSRATGEGVSIAPSRTDFSQGTLQQTGNGLDLAIQGNGFLVLQSGSQTFYARTGSFTVDPDGGVKLQGSPAGTNYRLMVLNPQNQPVAVNVNSNSTSAPTATTTITLGDNLSSTATTDTVSNVTVFDSLGGSHTWAIALTKVTGAGAAQNSWTATVTDENGAAVGTGTVNFNGGQVDPTTAKLAITATPSGGAAALPVTLDFSAVTSFDTGATSTLQSTKVDGNSVGSLSGVSVDSNGNLLLSYSNNTTKSLGAVAIANFRDPQALAKIGGGIYSNPDGGAPELLPSGSSNVGTVVSGQLESSNVNLTQEFGDLILIQRGYQASSEVVSVSNDMIQQLFGIRGQGG